MKKTSPKELTNSRHKKTPRCGVFYVDLALSYFDKERVNFIVTTILKNVSKR